MSIFHRYHEAVFKSATLLFCVVLCACTKPIDCPDANGTVLQIIKDSISDATNAESPDTRDLVAAYGFTLQGVTEASYNMESKVRACYANLVITPPEPVNTISAAWRSNAPEIQNALLRGAIIKVIKQGLTQGSIPYELEDVQIMISESEEKISRAGVAGYLLGGGTDFSGLLKVQKLVVEIDNIKFLSELEKRQFQIAVMDNENLISTIKKEVKNLSKFPTSIDSQGSMKYKINYAIQLNSKNESIINAIPPSLEAPIELANVSVNVMNYRESQSQTRTLNH